MSTETVPTVPTQAGRLMVQVNGRTVMMTRDQFQACRDNQVQPGDILGDVVIDQGDPIPLTLAQFNAWYPVREPARPSHGIGPRPKRRHR